MAARHSPVTKMAASLVGDTISEIMEGISSQGPFSENTTKNIIRHLTTLKDKCSDPSNLDLSDTFTQEWLGQVTDLFYLVEANATLHQKQSKRIVSFFSTCNLTLLLQLKLLEKQLRQVASESSLNKVKMLPNQEEPRSWRLKQCSAYCYFIFSESNYVVDRETLIRLWMAEGFLGPVINSSSSSSSSSSLQPEDLGREFINELCHGTTSPEDEDDNFNFGSSMLAKIKEHAFPNDDNLYVASLPLSDVSNKLKRVAMHFDLDVYNGIPKPLFKSKKHMRTFILPLYSDEIQSRLPHEVKLNWSARDAIFSSFKKLRVLALRDLGMQNLPPSIGGLKSLRYLDLSRNNMKELSNSIGELKYLQTLLLSHCHELEKLPDGAYHFPSLRHLHVDQCLKLKHMPSALNKLSWLRTLPHFVASTHKGLEGLVCLNNLRGKLEISHLERLELKESNSCFYLKEKEYLQCLTLRWNHEIYKNYEKCFPQEEEEEENQFHVLSQLEPHPKLKQLSVKGYKGNRFASWLSSLTNLMEISLYYCSKCQSLPLLGQIPSLKKLTLVSLDSLRFITNQNEGLGLTHVKILDCPNLTSWWENASPNNAKFSSISELTVKYCPKLSHMPLFPGIDGKLVLDCSNMEPLKSTLTVVPLDEDSGPPLYFLSYLTIRDCKKLKSIKGWKNLGWLQELNISNCKNIDLPIEEWEGMRCLRKLVIEDIPDLHSLPKGIEHIMPPFTLEIKSCPELKTLDTGDMHIFLYVEDCPKLQSLPQTVSVRINNCPLLETTAAATSVTYLNPIQQQQQQQQVSPTSTPSPPPSLLGHN